MTRRSLANWRFNAWLTLLLLLGVVAAGNRLAREHLLFDHDLTEEQLFAPSPVGKRMLGELSDTLSVKAYFTGEAKLGPVQIAKRRLIDQLERFAALSNGRMDLVYVDPNGSTEARVEAQGFGIQPFRGAAVQGTSEIIQDTYFGLVLRYRGREEVLPWVLPQSLEYLFLARVHLLTREEDVAVAFLTGDGTGDPATDGFAKARALVGQSHRVVEARNLARGEAVADDVSVLVVARPVDLHPRAVFAVDQFVQRGGRVLFLLDRTHVDLTSQTTTPLPTGLDELLRRWGAPVAEGLVWDQGRSNTISLNEAIDVGGQERRGREVSLAYPLWPNVGEDGLASDLPVTGGVNGVDLFWVQPVLPSELVPRNVKRQPLLSSTDLSWIVEPEEALVLDPQQLDAKAANLLAGGKGRTMELAVSLRGRFPSPFVDGAPAPWSEVAEATYRADVAEALEEGREPPARPVVTTDEAVASEAAEAQVVVVGDADWCRDGRFFTEGRNTTFLVNLVDWLALEDELLALRARMPRDRSIDDFLAQEREARGLVLPSISGDDPDFDRYARLESEAASAATARRWWWMAGALGGAVLLLAVLGLAWKVVFGVTAATPSRGGGR